MADLKHHNGSFPVGMGNSLDIARNMNAPGCFGGIDGDLHQALDRPGNVFPRLRGQVDHPRTQRCTVVNSIVVNPPWVVEVAGHLLQPGEEFRNASGAGADELRDLLERGRRIPGPAERQQNVLVSGKVFRCVVECGIDDVETAHSPDPLTVKLPPD